MLNTRTLFCFCLLFITVNLAAQYSHLKEKLDNDFLVVNGNTLRFTYIEHYAVVAGENDQIDCRVYDSERQVVHSEMLPNQYGLNQHELTLPSVGLNDCEFYTLEVSGKNKGEVSYLRFKAAGVNTEKVVVMAKVFLDGPHSSFLLPMFDRVREGGLIPSQSPYVGGSFSNITSQEVICGNIRPLSQFSLGTTGENAIVDWVFVELRSSSNPATVLRARPALLQRDGDIVAEDGESPLTFYIIGGSYYFSVRHRNHLGVMTATAVAMNATGTTIDFTSTATATWGSNAQKVVNGVRTLWQGDANMDGQVSSADVSFVNQAVTNHPNNLTNATGFTYREYVPEDVDLDGQVSIQYSNDDENKILQETILAHPNNTGGSSNFIVFEQLP